MIYLIHGDEQYLIDEKLKSIIKENKDSQLISFDGSSKTFNIRELFELCREIDIFSSRKLILVRDPYFLNKKCLESDEKIINEYFNNPEYETDLVFYTFNSTFNTKLSIFKSMSKNAQGLKYDRLKGNDFYLKCIDIVKKFNLKLSKEVLNILVNEANGSLSIFNSNIEVLSLYPEEINRKSLEGLITSNDELSVFNLVNAIINKDVGLSMKLIDKYLNNDDNVMGLIALLSNQLRFLYELSYYQSKGDTVAQIMNKTGISSSYRITKNLECLSRLKRNEILKLLSNLFKISYQIKNNSSIDDRLLLELFIVEMSVNEKN